MMKLKLIALFSLGLVALPVNAEQAAVINAPTVSDQPAQTGSQEEANKERILKGGKSSLRQRTAMAIEAVAEGNLQQGPAFLEANQAKPGVVSLASGVQYKVLKAGKGKNPTDNSEVKCRYKGTLIDGTVFDKTDDKQPSALKVSGFLPGLKEAVKMMSPGAKWQVVIPPQLAYGDKGNRGVGPNAVVIYDFEVVSVK